MICFSVAAASWSSVETASRNDPPRAAGDQRERRVGRVDPFALADTTEQRHQLGEAGPLERERLAARAHGGQDLGELGRAEDEDEMRRRLLDQLQQRVPGCVRELVGLVEDVDLVASLGRLEHDTFTDLTDVVDAALRGSIHLDHVERDARGDRDARMARAVRRRCRAVSHSWRLGQDSRHRRLAGAAGAGEEVCLAHLVTLDRVA